MTNAWFVRGVMSQWPHIEADGQRVIVPTHCLYPSNGIVQVIVDGGKDAFRVHDGGKAFTEFYSSGRVPEVPPATIRYITSRQGLIVTNEGIIQTPLIGTDRLAGAISLVANASKEAAHYLIDHHKAEPAARNLEEILEAILDRRFHNRWDRRPTVLGHSNKQQKFDYLIRFGKDKRLLIKVAKPEASSINAAIVAHLDVKAADFPDIEQRSVYDDAIVWSAPNLSLLAVGATVVPISAANDVLPRIAA
jgi:hypothetical protein